MYKGIVVAGIKRGTNLGFPTANIYLTDKSISGVYAAIVTAGDKRHHAAVYMNQDRDILEAHLLDFSGDLLGKEIEVSLKKKIREDMAFDEDEKLRTTIADDVQKVRAYFENAK